MTNIIINLTNIHYFPIQDSLISGLGINTYTLVLHLRHSPNHITHTQLSPMALFSGNITSKLILLHLSKSLSPNSVSII